MNVVDSTGMLLDAEGVVVLNNERKRLIFLNIISRSMVRSHVGVNASNTFFTSQYLYQSVVATF